MTKKTIFGFEPVWSEKDLRKMFENLKDKIDEDFAEVELRIIQPEVTQENWYKNNRAGKFKWTFWPEKVIELNLSHIGNFLEKALEGLIVHELAHYIIFSKQWPEGIDPSKIDEETREGFEKDADSLAIEWGFEEEIEALERCV